MPPLPISFINCRRRRRNSSLRMPGSLGSVQAGRIVTGSVAGNTQLDQLVMDQLHAGAHVLDDLRVGLLLFLGFRTGLDRCLADVREVAQHLFDLAAELLARNGAAGAEAVQEPLAPL